MEARNPVIPQRVAQYTVANRYALLILATFLTVFLSTGILRTSFDTSLSALLSNSDPYLD